MKKQVFNTLQTLKLWFGWTKKGYIRWVVGYNNFLGRSVQMHIASIKGYETRPRQLLYAAFDFPFNVLHVDLLIGVINSMNVHALNFDLKLGFREKLDGKICMKMVAI